MTLYDSLKQQRDELLGRQQARKNLLSYASSIEIPDAPLDPDDPDCEDFHECRKDLGKHHIVWLNLLQKLVDGELIVNGKKINRLMGLWPPGSGKSTYTSVVFVTWFMGRERAKKVILLSYSDDLPQAHGQKNRQICNSRQYRRIFNTALSNDTTAKGNFMLQQRSEYLGRGVLSGVTGKRADLLVSDDLIKNQEDADSQTMRDKTWNDYVSSARTRKKKGAIEVMIGTRWHWDDPIGRILPDNYAGQSGPIMCRDKNVWFVVCLPKICERADDILGREPGEILWPEYYSYEDIPQDQAIPRVWNSLMQQRPSAEEGSFFKEHMFHAYENAPDPRTMRCYGMSDYAVEEKQQNDWTVHIIVGQDPWDRLWLLDLWRGQQLSDVWVDQQIQMIVRWKPMAWLEPSEVIQKGIGPFRAKELKRFGLIGQYFEQHPNKGDKMLRAQSIRGYMHLNGLMVPAFAPWFPAFKSELLAFPAGKNDDQVDALALMGRVIDRSFGGRFPILQAGPKVISTDPRTCTVTLDDIWEASERDNARTRRQARIA